MSNPQQNNCTQNQSLRASAPQAGPEICLTISTLMDPKSSSPEGCSPHSQDIAYLKGATHRLPPAKSDHIGFLKG